MNKILDVVEDIKQNITDNQYKTIMDSLMEMHKKPVMYENHINNKFICLFRWLDTKLQITDDEYNVIKRSDLHKFIITEYFNDVYYKNIDFVKQVLKIFFMHPTKEQNNNHEFVYVKYRR
jgi:hypothetical protein